MFDDGIEGASVGNFALSGVFIYVMKQMAGCGENGYTASLMVERHQIVGLNLKENRSICGIR